MKAKLLPSLVALPLAMSVSQISHAMTAQELDETLKQQAKEIRLLKRELKKNKSTVRAVRDQVTGAARRLKIHGFATAGVTYTDTDLEYAGGFITKDANTQREAVLGVQMNFAANDKTDFILQMVGRGSEEFDIKSTWSYVRYRASDSVTWRAGRLNIPFFMISDYREVGFAYPWAKPPSEVYDHIFFDSHEGFDAIYTTSVGDIDMDFQILAGVVKNNGVFATLENTRLGGVNFNLATGPFRVHAGYVEGRLNDDPDSDAATELNQLDQGLQAVSGADGRILSPNNKADFFSLGIQFDNGSVVAISEFTRMEVDGLFGDQDSAYLTVGYRIGKWLPYVSIAQTETTDSEVRNERIALVESFEGPASTIVPTLGLGDPTVLSAEQRILLAGFSDFALNQGEITATVRDAIDVFLGSSSAQAAGQLQALLGAEAYAGAMALAGGALPSIGLLVEDNIPTIGRGLTQMGPEQTTYSVGFRYNLRPGIAVKLQLDHTKDFDEDGLGFYTADVSNDEALAASNKELDDGVNTLTLTIDTVF